MHAPSSTRKRLVRLHGRMYAGTRVLTLHVCVSLSCRWTEAMQIMKEGAKWELYIPSELAYGDRGAGGTSLTHFLAQEKS